MNFDDAQTKAVFLDKDGTLIEDKPYNVNPDCIQLLPGVSEGLNLLQAQGYQLIVVTNQSGIARGFFTEQDLFRVRNKLEELLSSAGIVLSDFYYCPHHPQGQIGQYAIDCSCRKPQPGMFYRAALEHNIDLSSSWMVGDILHDVEAGNRAGCKTVLIDNQHETEWELTPIRRPKFMAQDIESAARIILWEDAVEVNPWREELSI